METLSYHTSIKSPYIEKTGIEFSYNSHNNIGLYENSERITNEESSKVVQNIAKIPTEEYSKMLEQMNEFISFIGTFLSFRIDETSKRNVVTVYEASTGNVIRQIPGEEMLEIIRNLKNQATHYSSGLLIDKV
ncbi:Protein flaG [Candidatus Photodesmus katoptron]|uniref:FlaG n=1 Tax=Candidatus Photodesmus katoptron Akat1 TaxID=1236703 RepID=S3DJL3_9GAMM|nr:flagellar protein FlaG [Candidatus Photodesmus katoptron]EPE37895.1 flaG [Candidatus Photodesmus katoptron Akat1]KEY90385.1 Protein flaG [Candidatus Photodesmus katoptron]